MADKNVLVRVLIAKIVEGVEYCVNDVVAFEQRIAKYLSKAGEVDPDQDAVAYALATTGAQPKDHAAIVAALSETNPPAGKAGDEGEKAGAASGAGSSSAPVDLSPLDATPPTVVVETPAADANGAAPAEQSTQ